MIDYLEPMHRLIVGAEDPWVTYENAHEDVEQIYYSYIYTYVGLTCLFMAFIYGSLAERLTLTILRERPVDNWWDWLESWRFWPYLDLVGEIMKSLDYWIVMGVVVGIIDAETIVQYWDKLLYTHLIDFVPSLLHAGFFYIWETV